MSDVKKLWRKLSLRLFFPEERRLLIWTLVGPLLLVCSSLVLLSSFAPLQTLLLAMGVTLLLTFYFAPEKIAQFAFGGVIVFSLYCLKANSEKISFLEVVWTTQYVLSLFIAQKMIFSTKEYLLTTVKSYRAIVSDKELWESRFDTLREKIESDRKVWEIEIEAANNQAEEQVAYAKSLRRLVETAHSTIRQLEQRPVLEDEFDQLANLQHGRELLVSSVDSMRLIKEKDQRILELESLLVDTDVHQKHQELEKQQQLQQSVEQKLEKQIEKQLELEQHLEKQQDAQFQLEQQLEKQQAIEKQLEKQLEMHLEKQQAFEKEQELKQAKVDQLKKKSTIIIEGKEIGKEGVLRMLADLNDAREKNYQLEVLLRDSKEKLCDLESAYESRHSRNQQLLKTNTEKPITLQSLAKRAKK